MLDLTWADTLLIACLYFAGAAIWWHTKFKRLEVHYEKNKESDEPRDPPVRSD